MGIDYSLLSATAIWYAQVGALVVGHVAALVVAHDRAIADFGSTQQAVRSQYWMLAVMIGFTTLGLWLLSGGQRLMPPLGHAGQWLVQLAYAAPLVFMGALVLGNYLRRRREQRHQPRPKRPSA